MSNGKPAERKEESAKSSSGFGSFWRELKRRKVMRVIGIYAGVGWVVMEVSATVLPNLGFPQWMLSSLIILIILGFPVAMVVAWIYDLTPEGIRATDSVENEAETSTGADRPRAQHSLPLLIATAAVPTVLFGVLAIVFFFKARSASSELVMITSTLSKTDKSIAVLPFKNRSNLEEDLFFTDGIHDDLLSHISRIGGVKTISRTSVEGYRDTTKNVKTIGEELGVRTLLEGGVQRAGKQVRINVQLIDALMDSLLWSEIYVRELTAENVFDIQNEISRVVAKALQTVLSPEEQEQMEHLPTANLAALEAYFRGKERLKQLTAIDLQEAVEQFTEAITLDPDFALAHAILGETLVMQASYREGALPVQQQIAKAEPHILRALELDPQLSEAHVALGKLRYLGGGRGSDPTEIEAAYNKAIELNPNNAEAYKAYVNFSRGSLRSPEELVALLERYLELDPNSEDADALRAVKFETEGQIEKAEQQWLVIIEKNPADVYALGKLARSYFLRSFKFDDTIIQYRKILALDPANPGALNGTYKAYHNLGDFKRAIWWGEQAAKLHQDPVRSARQRCWALKLAEDDVERERVALEGLRHNPKDDELLMHMNDIDIKNGRAEIARARWVSSYPHLFDPAYELRYTEVWLAFDVARVLQATGDLELANRLLEKTLTAAKSVPTTVQTQNQIIGLHLLMGQEEEALEVVRNYLEGGGTPSRLMYEDTLQPLKNIPAYHELAAKRQVELDVQLKRINEMEANSELAPLPESLRY